MRPGGSRNSSWCLDILDEIQPASVRAVCYRLFTLGIISSTNKNSTNKVSSHLTCWARERGIIPATPGQLRALRRWHLAIPPNITKGTASDLIAAAAARAA